jgi:hypothetical protein
MPPKRYTTQSCTCFFTCFGALHFFFLGGLFLPSRIGRRTEPHARRRGSAPHKQQCARTFVRSSGAVGYPGLQCHGVHLPQPSLVKSSHLIKEGSIFLQPAIAHHTHACACYVCRVACSCSFLSGSPALFFLLNSAWAVGCPTIDVSAAHCRRFILNS